MLRRVPKFQAALPSLAFAYFALGTAALAVVGLALPVSRDLHVPAAQTGLLVSVLALTFAPAALLVQGFFGHWPRKRLLLAGLGLLALGLLAGALAPSFAVLLLSRVPVAVGAAMVGPVASATATQLVGPERQPQALAVVFAGFGLSSVLGVPLASLLAPALGWRGTLVALAVLAALAALLIARLVPSVPGGSRLTPALLRRALDTSGVRPALLATLLQIGAPFVVYGVTGSYLAERFGSSPAAVSATLLAFGAAGLVGNALAGRLAGSLGQARTLAASLVGATLVAAALLVLPRDPLVGGLVFAALSLFTQMFQTPQQARLIRLDPTQRGLMLALNASVVYLGISLGSWLGSALLPALGAQPLTALSLAMLLVALAASSAVPRPVAQARPA